MNYHEIQLVCTSASNLLVSVEDEILQWTDDKLKLEAKLLRFISRNEEMESNMPENWVSMLAAQYIAGAVFAYPLVLRKYLKARGHELKDSEKEWIRSFQQRPWFYSLCLDAGPGS